MKRRVCSWSAWVERILKWWRCTPAPKKSAMAGYRSFRTQCTPCKTLSCSLWDRGCTGCVPVVIEPCLLSRDRDEDEGVPCESEFEKKLSDAKVRGLKGKTCLEQSWGAIVEKCMGDFGLCFVVELWFFSILHPANNCSPGLQLTFLALFIFWACCARLPRALLCYQTQHILSCSTRWGQYLRNRSGFFARAFIFCLHPCFLFTPTEQLQQKDKQILLLLEEKTKIFQDMADSSVQEEMPGSRLLFRANTEEAPKGEAIMKTAINEGEPVTWHVNYSNQL